MNLQCAPNIKHDFDRKGIHAIRDISDGQELVAFYPACEWDLASPFPCDCGAKDCLEFIGGAKFIPESKIEHFLPLFAPHIVLQLQERKTGKKKALSDSST